MIVNSKLFSSFLNIFFKDGPLKRVGLGLKPEPKCWAQPSPSIKLGRIIPAQPSICHDLLFIFKKYTEFFFFSINVCVLILINTCIRYIQKHLLKKVYLSIRRKNYLKRTLNQFIILTINNFYSKNTFYFNT